MPFPLPLCHSTSVIFFISFLGTSFSSFVLYFGWFFVTGCPLASCNCDDYNTFNTSLAICSVTVHLQPLHIIVICLLPHTLIHFHRGTHTQVQMGMEHYFIIAFIFIFTFALWFTMAITFIIYVDFTLLSFCWQKMWKIVAERVCTYTYIIFNIFHNLLQFYLLLEVESVYVILL